jgi:hypothetical protein
MSLIIDLIFEPRPLQWVVLRFSAAASPPLCTKNEYTAMKA